MPPMNGSMSESKNSTNNQFSPFLLPYPPCCLLLCPSVCLSVFCLYCLLGGFTFLCLEPVNFSIYLKRQFISIIFVEILCCSSCREGRRDNKTKLANNDDPQAFIWQSPFALVAIALSLSLSLFQWWLIHLWAMCKHSQWKLASSCTVVHIATLIAISHEWVN